MNQQDKDGQTLRPFPDLTGLPVKYGERTGKVLLINEGSKYPIVVKWDDNPFNSSFTLEGRYSIHGEVVLQGLEEGR